MARVAPLSPRPVARVDPIPVAWGGLVASVGLMSGAGRDWPVRLAVAVLTFGVGGFLSGVRASSRRPAHAFAAGLVGYAIHACFVALAHVIDVLGGPDAPAIAPGTGREWVTAAAVALAAALAGGMVAHSWLTPAGPRRR